MEIRLERPDDEASVRQVHLQAFGGHGKKVAALNDDLRASGTEPVAGWVWKSNVTTLMSWLARFANSEHGELDATAVAHGLVDTDVDADRWYEYPLGYDPLLKVYLAQHVGGAEVSVRVEGDMDAAVEARVQTVVEILAEVRSDT